MLCGELAPYMNKNVKNTDGERDEAIKQEGRKRLKTANSAQCLTFSFWCFARRASTTAPTACLGECVLKKARRHALLLSLLPLLQQQISLSAEAMFCIQAQM